MVIQAFISFIYGVIQGSWTVSAIALKYVLFLQIIYAFRAEGDFFENFETEVEEYSRELVSIIVALGTIVSITGVEFSAMFRSASYIIAAIYFSYLFWKF